MLLRVLPFGFDLASYSAASRLNLQFFPRALANLGETNSKNIITNLPVISICSGWKCVNAKYGPIYTLFAHREFTGLSPL